MKRKLTIFLSVIIFVISINTCYVKASVSGNDIIEQNIVQLTNGVLEGYNRLLRYTGIIIDTGIEASRSAGQFVKDRLIALGLLNNDATDEDVQEFFDDNIRQTGKSVEYTSNLNVYVKSEISQIQQEYGFFYAYTFDIVKNTSKFGSGDLYSAVRSFCEANQGSNYISITGFNSDSSCFICKYPIASYGLVFNQNYGSNDFKARAYNSSNWVELGQSGNRTIYKYNTTTKQFDTAYNNYTSQYYCTYSDIGSMPSGEDLISVGSQQIKVFRTLADFQNNSVGESPYYISGSYNTYANTSGSYNTNTDDHSVTYNDIVNFNNQYYGDNGNYPTAETIYQYINTNQGTGTGDDNTPTPTPTPGPDDPGGGGSGSGGSGSIFDWLTRIGELIGNLISGVGGFIAGILEGVVNALTSILETITSIITTITTSIPDNFNNLMTTILGWLPEEWTAVISAFLLVSLLVGLFKLFRG